MLASTLCVYMELSTNYTSYSNFFSDKKSIDSELISIYQVHLCEKQKTLNNGLPYYKDKP